MDDERYIELYGELVSLRELGLSSLICSALAFLLFYLSPSIASFMGMPNLTNALKITFGAIGAFLGFFISIPLTKVKRKIILEGD
ncbi:MAG: hypothetical protein ACP5HH_06200 [Fervidicoccaceae archaeon]|jgi:hypothetical protein